MKESNPDLEAKPLILSRIYLFSKHQKRKMLWSGSPFSMACKGTVLVTLHQEANNIVVTPPISYVKL